MFKGTEEGQEDITRLQKAFCPDEIFLTCKKVHGKNKKCDPSISEECADTVSKLYLSWTPQGYVRALAPNGKDHYIGHTLHHIVSNKWNNDFSYLEPTTQAHNLTAVEVQRCVAGFLLQKMANCNFLQQSGH